MKFPKLLVITLTGCLLLGASSANAQLAPDLDWLYLDCEASETEDGTCPEVEGLTQLVSRCVVASRELQSNGWTLMELESINLLRRLRGRMTMQLFQKGLNISTLYCLLRVRLEDG